MLLQSPLRPVLTPIMRGIFDPAQSIAAAWSPLSLWPDGISSAGMWISPRTLTSEWQDYTGTTPVVTPGTVADSANPVGLALDIRAGATVLTDPGNHMLQSTSAARPLMSARRNLLTYTEDFSNAVWETYVFSGSPTLVKTPDYATAPDGSMTACRVQCDAMGGNGTVLYQGPIVNGVYPKSVWIKSNTGVNQVITIVAGEPSAKVTVTSTWTRYSCAANIGTHYAFQVGVYLPDGTDSSCDILIWHPQVELGPTATPYQSVPGDGSTYDGNPTKFPYYLKFDGVDDGMATAAFTAGTLINGMDCMIAVRRDSAASVIAGIHATTIASEYTGLAVSGAAYTSVDVAGSPTVWVDGVQLTGGTAVTAGTLYDALTVGDWHILEYRNLDLSGAGWTMIRFSQYINFTLNGARGDIMLFESTASTEDKDAARQYLADYYGVTLP